MKIPHIAIYIRVSTTDQVEDGLSMDSQPASVIGKLGERVGEGRFTFEIFSDEGKSGGSGPVPWDTVRKPRARKGLWNLIQGLREGKFTHVGAYRLDRIYRDMLGQIGFYELLMQPMKIEYVLVKDSFDTSLTGQFTHKMLSSVAEYQRQQISENIKQNLAYRREQGYYLGTVPFGWRRELPDEFVGRRPNILPVQSEAEVVARIKDLYLSGMSERAISRVLNEEGVAHKKSIGKWRTNTVNLVLINPTHAGLVRQADGSLKEGLHFEHRVYDRSELSRIHSRLERNRKRLKGVPRTQPFRLFSGIAYCGHCGQKLASSFHTSSPGYRCLGLSISSDGSHVYIGARRLEELVVGQLAHLAASAKVLGEIENQVETLIRGQDVQIAKRASEVRSARARVEDESDELVEAIAKKTLSHARAKKTLDELENTAARLDRELFELDRQLSRSSDRIEEIKNAKRQIHKFTEVWTHLSDAERREALHTVIERIDVHTEAERKWLRIKFVFAESPVELEVLRGAERYRTGKPDGIASLTPRELAALKHVLDGATYVQIGKYFESTAVNAHSTLRHACIKLGVKNFSEAAKLAEPLIRRIQDQLPLFGPANRTRHLAKRLKVMEYQIIGLRAEGLNPKEIALRTGIDQARVSTMLDRGLARLEVKTAKAALIKLTNDESYLPISMSNRRRIG
ncbi:MAG: recombinase family protein [Fimbriimonadaceae bacterium]